MRALIVACTVILSAFSSFGADASDLPLEARNVISAMERQVTDIQKKAVADLKGVMQKEASAGRMEKVLLLTEIIKEIEAKIAEPTLKKSNAKHDEILAGRWTMPMVKFEITFEKGRRYSAKFGDDVKWSGTWKVDGDKLLVNHPISNSTDVFELPPKRESAGGRTVYKLYGRTDKGEGRVLVKDD
jgi:hypothetical protein